MKQLFIGGGIVLLLIGGWWMTTQNQTNNATVTTEDTMMETELESMVDSTGPLPDAPTSMNDAPEGNDAMMEIETVATDTTLASRGIYQAFTPAALAASTATHNVLIFSAPWCPTCRALDSDITANLTDLPNDVALFTVDYDTNIALRQQYGVTTQHTLVLVDTDGTALKSWRGGTTLSALLANL